MSIPKLNPGKYNMEVSLDTKSKLGKITSQRSIEVIENNHAALQRQYISTYMMSSKGPSPELLAKMLNAASCETIKPGVPYNISGPEKCVTGEYPGVDSFSAVLTLKPGKDALNLQAEVTDAYFSVAKPKADPQGASSLSIHICPSGCSFDSFALTVVPDGAEGSARLVFGYSVFGEYWEDEDVTESLDGIFASWKRTAKGYTLSVEIPWSTLEEFGDTWNSEWTRMAVKACINTKGPKGKLQICTGLPGEPTEMFTYSTLLRE